MVPCIFMGRAEQVRETGKQRMAAYKCPKKVQLPLSVRDREK